MRRGTTPTFAFEVDCDLTGWEVYATFGQGRVEVTRTDVEVEPAEGGCTASVTLTQAETLLFKAGEAQAQLRAVKDGVAVATDVLDFEVGKIVLDGEIPQGV